VVLSQEYPPHAARSYFAEDPMSGKTIRQIFRFPGPVSAGHVQRIVDRRHRFDLPAEFGREISEFFAEDLHVDFFPARLPVQVFGERLRDALLSFAAHRL